MRAYAENARRAFDGQSDELRAHLLASIVNTTLTENDPETSVLKHLCRIFPYAEVADTLDRHFYEANSEMRITVIEAIAEILFEHLSRVAGGRDAFNDWYVDASAREARYLSTRAATRRAAELLSRYLRNKNELVSFHAAKGLYESNRSEAVEKLRKLANGNDPQVRALVAELAQEWGIE